MDGMDCVYVLEEEKPNLLGSVHCYKLHQPSLMCSPSIAVCDQYPKPIEKSQRERGERNVKERAMQRALGLLGTSNFLAGV